MRDSAENVYNSAFMKKPRDSTQSIELVYDGPEVKDGTMAVEDMVSALIGFGRAYAKVAEIRNVKVQHRLRVTGIKRASADIQLVAQFLTPEMLDGVANLVKASSAILGSIALVIKLTRHAGKPSKDQNVTVKGNGNVVVVNQAGATLEVPKSDYELYRSRLIDPDLHQLTRPLEEGRIDVLRLRENNRPVEGSEIRAEEKDLFYHSLSAVTTTKDDVWLEGELRSLNKKTNTGMFYLNDGRGVRYRFDPRSPARLYKGFAYVGPVRVRCRAHLDDSLNPIFIEIFDVDKLQMHLPGSSPSDEE